MHVVVCGAGYAGLATTRRLERSLPADVDLTLINDRPDHVLQHELHRAIRTPSVVDDLTVSLPSILDRTRVHVATVEEIDRQERIVHCSTGPIAYDVAVVALGAETDFFGLEDVRSRATELKRRADPIRIRRRVLETIRDRSSGGGVVVCGGGLSGIQVAGEIAALRRAVDTGGIPEVILLEQQDTVAPEFPEPFRQEVAEALTDQGVDVRTEASVTGAGNDAVHLEGDASIPADVLIWTGGIRGSTATDRERQPVGPELRLDDRTFVCGDAARVTDDSGTRVPATAQAAIQQGWTAARNVTRLVEAIRSQDPARIDVETGAVVTPESDSRAYPTPIMEEYRYRSPGWVVSVGTETVAIVESRVLTGKPARIAKAGVVARYLARLGEVGKATRMARLELAGGRSGGG